MLSIDQELNEKALPSPLPYLLEEGCCVFPALFLQEEGTPAQSHAWKRWECLALAEGREMGGHIFQEKKKKKSTAI